MATGQLFFFGGGWSKIIGGGGVSEKNVGTVFYAQFFSKKIISFLHRNICYVVKKWFYHQNSTSNLKKKKLGGMTFSQRGGGVNTLSTWHPVAMYGPGQEDMLSIELKTL
jgi:hypothetical protein